MEETKLFCPSCSQEKVEKIESIPTRLIQEYYAENGVDVGYLFENVENLDRYQCGECGLQFFRPVVLGDDRYYRSMQQGDWYYLEEKPEYDYVAKWIGAEDRVLDVGSGRGAFSRKIGSPFYQGLEFSQSAVELAAKEGVNVIPESVEDHARSHAGQYDVVCVFQVLEHVAHPKEFLEGCVACLKKGGKLAIAVPNSRSFLEWRRNYLNIPPHHQLLWSERSLSKLAQLHDLQVLEIYKEKVTEIHRESFYSTLLLSLGDKILPGRISSVKGSQFGNHAAGNEEPSAQQGGKDLAHRAADVVKDCFRLVKLHRFFDGHTVTAIYQKK